MAYISISTCTYGNPLHTLDSVLSYMYLYLSLYLKHSKKLSRLGDVKHLMSLKSRNSNFDLDFSFFSAIFILFGMKELEKMVWKRIRNWRVDVSSFPLLFHSIFLICLLYLMYLYDISILYEYGVVVCNREWNRR